MNSEINLKSAPPSIFNHIINISTNLKKELFRKTIHMMSSIIPFLYFFYRPLTMISILLLTFLYLISEMLRIHKIRIPIITGITELASRSKDKGKVVLGPVTLTTGIFLSFVFFEYYTAIIAIFALSFGDGVASLFGKMIGGPKIPFTGGKTFSGTIGCSLTLIIVYLSCGLSIKDAIIIACFSAIIEAFPTGDFDNLIIPVATGLFTYYIIF